jgi:hypothetical protein
LSYGREGRGMELQVEKYRDLINKISSNFLKTNRRSNQIDFESELWLKLYDFIRKNSGEENNFPLIKSVLRTHILFLLRKESSTRKKVDSIEDLILRGVDLVYKGFGPYEKIEFEEIRDFINEWLSQQDEVSKNFFKELLLDMDGDRIFIHRVRRNLGMSSNKCYYIINSLKSFLEKKGVTCVS